MSIVCFVISSIVVALMLVLINYDLKNNHVIYNKIEILLRVFITYSAIFMILTIGFIVEDMYKFEGYFMIVVLLFAKFSPNLTLWLNRKKTINQELENFIKKHHKSLMFSFLLTIMYIAYCDKSYILLAATSSFFISSFVDCDIYIVSKENLLDTKNKVFVFLKKHWIVIPFSLAFVVLYAKTPELEKIYDTYTISITLPPLIGIGVSYILLCVKKIKAERKETSE